MMDANKMDKVLGGLYGALVGDACGVPYEFKAPGKIPSYEKIDMAPPPGYPRTWASIPEGTYSDDGAQVLCLFETLLNSNPQQIDTAMLLHKLQQWLRYGYMAVDDETFDVGNQTSAALTNGNVDKLDAPQFNGNGSLMRVIPVGLLGNTQQEIFYNAWHSSGVTHPHARSRLCCVLYSLIASYMLEGEEDVYAAYDQAMLYAEHYVANVMISDPKNAELLAELKYIAEWENHECTGTGFVVDSFWTAIKVLNVAESYEDVIKRSIGYGNDTDTTACIAGGLAGIKYGYQGIPDRWIEQLRGKEIIRRVVDRWLYITATNNIRATYPLQVAEEIVSVQPMPPVDWDALEKSALWQSYCARHFGKDK